MKFVLKLIVVSEVVSSIIKLTQDALKELIETNCCKYAYEVATHLKVPICRTNLPGHTLSINQQGVNILGFVVRCVWFRQPFDSQAIPLQERVSRPPIL